MSYGEADDGDYDWPIDYACRCGHTGQLARADALPRDSEWTCTQRACDTIFPVPPAHRR